MFSYFLPYILTTDEVTGRLVAFLSGLAHITLPVPVSNDTTLDEAWIQGGTAGMIIALDTEGSGHITTYPSDQSTVSLQIPLESEKDMPEHEIVGEGPCRFAQVGGQLGN